MEPFRTTFTTPRPLDCYREDQSNGNRRTLSKPSRTKWLLVVGRGCQGPSAFPMWGPMWGRDRITGIYQTKTMHFGGSGGIRTHERVSPLLVFKTSAFDHSATLPQVDQRKTHRQRPAEVIGTRPDLKPISAQIGFMKHPRLKTVKIRRELLPDFPWQGHNATLRTTHRTLGPVQQDGQACLWGQQWANHANRQ